MIVYSTSTLALPLGELAKIKDFCLRGYSVTPLRPVYTLGTSPKGRGKLLR